MTKTELANVFVAAGQANKAVAAAKNKKASIKAVGAFQALDGHLKVDGLWGFNTKTAAAWYLQDKNVTKSAFPVSKLTWVPPTVEDSQPATPEQKQAVAARNEMIVSHAAVPPPPHVKKIAHNKKVPVAAKPSVSKAKKVKSKPAIVTPSAVTPKKVKIKNKRAPTVTNIPSQSAVVLQSPAYGQGIPGVINTGAEEQIVAYLNNTINPKIDSITAMLAESAIQKQATSEHNKIMSDTEYKNQLLTDIAYIKTKLANASSAKLGRKEIAALLM